MFSDLLYKRNLKSLTSLNCPLSADTRLLHPAILQQLPPTLPLLLNTLPDKTMRMGAGAPVIPPLLIPPNTAPPTISLLLHLGQSFCFLELANLRMLTLLNRSYRRYLLISSYLKIVLNCPCTIQSLVSGLCTDPNLQNNLSNNTFLQI